MNDEAREELISAYLDGELTAEEQRRVEQLLVDSAEHRQLFEELRSLRASFKILPCYKLPEDLSQRVLRQAEEELLRDRSASGSSSPAAQSMNTAPPIDAAQPADAARSNDAAGGERFVVRAADEEQHWSYRPGWRVIFWPAVVVAAAVAMMVLGPKASAMSGTSLRPRPASAARRRKNQQPAMPLASRNRRPRLAPPRRRHFKIKPRTSRSPTRISHPRLAVASSACQR